MTAGDRVLIVGAGRAGLAAAEGLRDCGFGGEVLMLGAESSAPYDRPACSKGILRGRQRPNDVLLPVRPDADIVFGLGRTAVHVDPVGRYVYTDADEELHYDGLVIASGSRPALPADWPVDQPGFHVLYGLSGAWSLRQELHTAARVAIIGGGLSGCETACTVRELARDCVIIDSNSGVMRRAIGALASEYVTEAVREDGVELRLGCRVQQVQRRRRGWALALSDGSEVVADLVVATLGDRPDVDWLRASGRFDLSDGVLCDERLRAVGVPGVVAAGSVARWPNLRFGPTPVRYGHWIAAYELGHFAARSLMAGDGPAEPAVVLPRYWSDQFGLRLQVCGQLPDHAEVSVTRLRPGRRDAARTGVLFGYSIAGQLVGLVAVNAPAAFTSIARTMLETPYAAPVVAASPEASSLGASSLEASRRPTARRHLTAV